MVDQIPAVLVLAPLFGALLIGLIGHRDHRVCFPIALASLSVTFFGAIAAAQHVFTNGPMDYFVGGWEKPLGIGIHLRIDALNALLLIAIATVAVLVTFFSIRRVGEKNTEKTHYFYILFLLLCLGLFGITIAADAFNLFVLIEVSSLTSYGLIAMGSSRSGAYAAFNYVLMGTTITEAKTFTVNAVWVRARVDRSAITPAPGSYRQATLGSVDTVLLNH